MNSTHRGHPLTGGGLPASVGLVATRAPCGTADASTGDACDGAGQRPGGHPGSLALPGPEPRHSGPDEILTQRHEQQPPAAVAIRVASGRENGWQWAFAPWPIADLRSSPVRAATSGRDGISPRRLPPHRRPGRHRRRDDRPAACQSGLGRPRSAGWPAAWPPARGDDPRFGFGPRPSRPRPAVGR